MFSLVNSVRSRIEPFSTASPMFWESSIGMSKFVLRAANWVKIASCHCGFGTVLTLTVTFGRVFVYSLPSSSSAAAGGHSNHRNVSSIGWSDRAWRPWPVRHRRLRLRHLHCRHRRQAVTAAAIAVSDAETASLPFITPPPRGLVLLTPTYGGTANLARGLQEPTRSLHSLSTHRAISCIALQPVIQSDHGRRVRAILVRRADPSDGSILRTLESASPRDGIAAVDAAADAARGLGFARSARARGDPPERVWVDDRATGRDRRGDRTRDGKAVC